MSWRSRPPSQYVGVKKSGANVPLWALVLVSVICLILGVTAGLTLRTDQEQPVDPLGKSTTVKRERLVSDAHHELAASTQLDAATNIKGQPSSFGLIVLGEEEQDVCVTGQHGFKVHDWYSSACGIQVTWYLAVKHGSSKTVDAAALARFQARRIPTLGSFEWTEKSGPLPNKLSGQVVSQPITSTSQLTAFQQANRIRFPEQENVYHDKATTFDLAIAYRDHAHGRKVVARISMTAQYAWN